jgi:hypothetical protein
MDTTQLLNTLQQQLSLNAAPKKKRKRGGLAGLWDRNKGVIKPLVSGVAGAFGGPIGGALAGGLMGGLDRKGKGGVGFDLGGGLRGAAGGALAGAAGAGARGLFTGGTAGAKTALTNYGNQMGLAKGGAEGVGRGALRTGIDKTLAFARDNPAMSGAALTTAGTMMAGNQQARIAREQEAFERDLFNRQEADRRALAEALMPLFLSIQNRATGVR